MGLCYDVMTAYHCCNPETLSIIMRGADTFQLIGLINSLKKVLNH